MGEERTIVVKVVKEVIGIVLESKTVLEIGFRGSKKELLSLLRERIVSILSPHIKLKEEEKVLEIILSKDAKVTKEINDLVLYYYPRSEQPRTLIALALYRILKDPNAYLRKAHYYIGYSEEDIILSLKTASLFFLAPVPYTLSKTMAVGITREELYELLLKLPENILRSFIFASSETISSPREFLEVNKSVLDKFYYLYYIPVKSRIGRGPATILDSSRWVKYLLSAPRVFSRELPSEFYEAYRHSLVNDEIETIDGIKIGKRIGLAVPRNIHLGRYVIERTGDFYDRSGLGYTKKRAIEEIRESNNPGETLLRIALRTSSGAPSIYEAFYLNVASLTYEITKMLLEKKDSEKLMNIRRYVASRVPIPI